MSFHNPGSFADSQPAQAGSLMAPVTYRPSKGGDAAIREHLPLVRRLAWHVHDAMSTSVEVEDLVQVGLLALVEALRGADNRAGPEFKAYLTTRLRGAMIDELRRDYVRTLRTRGVPTRAIVLKHALRNAGSPALTVLSLEFIQMFGAALIIENVFALPGYGSYAFNASLQGDIPVVLGIAAFGVALVIVVNLVTDLANGWLNPKARVR